jgi:DnaJ-class molecular chaperone
MKQSRKTRNLLATHLPAEPGFKPDKRKSAWLDDHTPCKTCNGTGQDPAGHRWQDEHGNFHVHTCFTCRGFGY